MGTASVIIRKTLFRVGTGAAFSAVWYYFNGSWLTVGQPLVFFGMMYVTAAWFNYLKNDDFRVLNFNTKHVDGWSAKLKTFLNMGGVKVHGDSTDEQDDRAAGRAEARINIKANLAAAAILILSSFAFMNMVRFN